MLKSLKQLHTMWTWLHHASGSRGWVVAQIVVTDGQTRQECVNMKDWENHLGPIPALAFEGQPFLHTGMYTEGSAGPHNVAVVSASGDNFRRALKIKMLCRDIAIGTVFEQILSGDNSFTDLVAFYAFYVETYCQLGIETPKKMIVITFVEMNLIGYTRHIHDNIPVLADICQVNP